MLEAPILWPPDGKSCLTGKNPDAGKDWRQKKRVAEDETVRRHYQFSGQEFEQTPGDSGGQRSLRAATQRVAESHTWLSDWTAAWRWGFQTITRASWGAGDFHEVWSLFRKAQTPRAPMRAAGPPLLRLFSVTTLERHAALTGKTLPPQMARQSLFPWTAACLFKALPSETVTSTNSSTTDRLRTHKLRNAWYLSSNTPYLHT